MPVEAAGLDVGLDQDLRVHVQQNYVREGRLFGAVSQNALTADERMALLRAGWIARPFIDAPVMEAPSLDIVWWELRRRHRDVTLHRVHHKLPANTPWAGNRVAILEELLASVWEEKEEEILTLLSAWSYASVWNEPEPTRTDGGSVDSFQTFFFYSQRMRDSAERVLNEGVVPPLEGEEFWTLIEALISD